MSYVAIQWNGTTLPYCKPDGIALNEVVVGGQRRVGSGALVTDRVARKMRITLSWEGLSETEYTAFMSTYATNSLLSSVLRLPNGRTYTVQEEVNSWQESVWYDGAGAPYYDISLAFLET